MSSKVSSFNPEFVSELRSEMLRDSKSGQALTRSTTLSRENAQYVKDFRITRDEINEAYARARAKK